MTRSPRASRSVSARCHLAASALVIVALGCRSAPPPATSSPTLVVVNARIWTGDVSRPWAEALAVTGDRISAVGSTADIEAAAGGARLVNAGGRLVTPGFIDSHVHFRDGGFRLASVQLRDAPTPQVFTARIEAFAATVPAGTWIQGGDWNHELWGGELPRREWIDAVTPNHPVWVHRLDGHMALANSAALQAAGITRATKDVEGGAIVRDAKGDPTGVLKDNAMGLVDKVVPEPSAEMNARALAAAMAYVNARGVTSVHHMGSWLDLETFARAHAEHALTTRIYAAVPLDSWERLQTAVAAKQYGGADGRGDEWLGVGGLKGFVDGSLGSHTAAMLDPFTDAPKDRGFFVNTPDHLYEWTSRADKAGLHVMVHAIGDRANRTILDIYERVARENGPRDRRFRVEHAQHPTAVDIARFGALGVIASMQPYHAIDDGVWADKVLGPERVKTTYAFRSFLDANARLAFSSDWFVAPPTPLEGIYAAVTRRTLDGKHPDGWVPEQKIAVEDALRAYTTTAAYASFDESRKGTIASGLLADFVMLDRDIFTVAPAEIREANVLLTVVGGKTVYEAGGGAPTRTSP
ncbi:MAG: amidohydrolase [Vicinamibacterales bacterium]